MAAAVVSMDVVDGATTYRGVPVDLGQAASAVLSHLYSVHSMRPGAIGLVSNGVALDPTSPLSALGVGPQSPLSVARAAPPARAADDSAARTEALRAEFDHLVLEAERKWTKGAIVTKLGYGSPKNPSRALKAIRDGSSRTVELKAAVAILRTLLTEPVEPQIMLINVVDMWTVFWQVPVDVTKTAAEVLAYLHDEVIEVGADGLATDLDPNTKLDPQQPLRDFDTSRPLIVLRSEASTARALHVQQAEFDELVSTVGGGMATLAQLFDCKPADVDATLARIREGTAPEMALEDAIATLHRRAATQAAEPESKSNTDLELFDDAVAALIADGVSPGAISKMLDYTGSNGSRDLERTRNGKCQKFNVAAAVQVLQEALLKRRDALPKPTRDPHTEEDTSPQQSSDVDTFVALVLQVKAQRAWSWDEISKRLGYFGHNGRRDLAAIRDGRSRTCTIGRAIKLLRELLQKPTTPPPSTPAPEFAPTSPVMEFNTLLEAVKLQRGLNDDAISKVFNYSGANGSRDLNKIRADVSTRCSLAKAIRILRGMQPKTQRGM